MKTIKKLIIRFISTVAPKYLYRKSSFSVEGEDLLLYSFLQNQKIMKGFYIDIGAHHPYRFSNTALLYRRGWNGINIDADPVQIKLFTKWRRRDLNLNFAISDTLERLTYFEFNEGALNSFDEELALSRVNHKYKIISRIEVEMYPLKEILERYLPNNQAIDLMNIDVEGWDIRVLKSNDWSRFIPKFILIESDFDINSLEKNEVHSFLAQKNYRFVARSLSTSLYQHL